MHKPRWISIAVYAFPIIISILFAILYVLMQMRGIYGGDAGDLVTAAYLWGIPHPPGYPLYTFFSGLFIRVLSIDTVAWRAGFMSSLPMALSLFFLWRVLYRITKSLSASTITVFVYGTLGPVWLNGITQEVFGLFSFFSAIFFDRFFAWWEDQKVNQLYWLAFLSGLALTHHTLIVLSIVPALVFVFFDKSTRTKQFISNWWRLLLLGILGMLPYVYAPIVSFLGTPFDTEHASTVDGFFRLITRASYGTFQATTSTPSFLERILNIYTFFETSFKDFGLVSILVLIIGVGYMRRIHWKWYYFLIVCLLFWILFFFLAGFPQLSNYHMGTLLRFFVVPYQILSAFVAIGIVGLVKKINNRRPASLILQFVLCVAIVSSLYGRTKANFTAYSILKDDHSMEQLATDMLQSAPENAIIYPFQDTTVYALFYNYFVLHQRPDLKYVKLPLLGRRHYRDIIHRMYPDLILPDESQNLNTNQILTDFFSKNTSQRVLVSDQEVDWILGGDWFPTGLLFRFVPTTTYSINHKNLVLQNEYLWSTFSPPFHLLPYQKEISMLTDTLRVYAQHKAQFARELAVATMPVETILQTMNEALKMEISVQPESYLATVTYLYSHNRCLDAKNVLDLIYQKWGEDKVILKEYHLLQNSCSIDDAEIRRLNEEYLKRFSGDATLLIQ